jgi:hypothetical protein
MNKKSPPKMTAWNWALAIATCRAGAMFNEIFPDPEPIDFKKLFEFMRKYQKETSHD